MNSLSGKKVLIVKLRYIGDTLSIAPVAASLAREAPGVRIDVLVNQGTEAVLAHDPNIHRLWTYDRRRAKGSLRASVGYHIDFFRKLRPRHYDVILDFTHGDRAAFLCFLIGAPLRVTYRDASRLSRLLMNRIVDAEPIDFHIVDYQLQALKLLGITEFDRTLKMVIPAVVQDRVDRLLDRHGIGEKQTTVVIHPGAGGPLRQWKPQRFGRIAGRLAERPETAVLLIGGPGDGTLVDRVAAHMQTVPAFQSTGLDLLETAALIRRCDLFIGNDSAPAHMAAAVGTASLTLFGPTWPHMWRPLSPNGRVIFKEVPCRACRQEHCVRPEQTCMDMIGAEEVWQAVREMLSEGPGARSESLLQKNKTTDKQP